MGQGRVWRGEILNKKKNGELFPLYASVYQLLDEEGNFIAGVGFQEDITKRKQAEEEIHYQANLLKNVAEAVIATDTDLRVVSWNEGAEQIYGWRKDEVVGKNIDDVCKTEFMGVR